MYKSVKAYDEAGKHNDALFTIQAIGNVYSTQQEYSRAIAYFDTAIVLTKKAARFFLCAIYTIIKDRHFRILINTIHQVTIWKKVSGFQNN